MTQNQNNEQRLVVSEDNLPAKLPVIQYALIYWLVADRYEYPLWLNLLAGAVLALGLAGISIMKGRERPVDIFKK